MPATIPYGITYPCLSPIVNPSDFYDFAMTTEAALSAVNALTPALLRRDYVAAEGVNPNTAVGVTSTVSWNTPTAANNPNGMFSAGSPTVFTLQSSGSFMVGLHITNLTSPTTETSVRGAVLLAGAEQIWGKTGGPTSFSTQFAISGLIMSATAGQQITVTFLWTGTGGPITPLFDIQICKISDL